MSVAHLASICAKLTAVGVAGAMLAGCGERYSWNQKLVLEVETPKGIHSGGSVVGFTVKEKLIKWTPGEVGRNPYSIAEAGEASFVEVVPGRFLFALLGNGRELAETLFFSEPYPSWIERVRSLNDLRQTVEVPREQYPVLATFMNINDPKSLRLVDPDNLAAVFGAGVRLKAITLETTAEPITKGRIEDVLPWMSGNKINPEVNDGRKGTLRYPNKSVRGYGTISTLQFIRR
jgi:hypothetical protein